MALVRVGITVQGRVQGVGFRYFTHHAAVKHHITGWVRNTANGAVTMEAQGESDVLELFKAQIHEGPILARVKDMVVIDMPTLPGEAAFQIRH